MAGPTTPGVPVYQTIIHSDSDQPHLPPRLTGLGLAGLGAGYGGVGGLSYGIPQQIRYQEINSVPLGVIQPYAGIGGKRLLWVNLLSLG